jgi:hypothetical protein
MLPAGPPFWKPTRNRLIEVSEDRAVASRSLHQRTLPRDQDGATETQNREVSESPLAITHQPSNKTSDKSTYFQDRHLAQPSERQAILLPRSRKARHNIQLDIVALPEVGRKRHCTTEARAKICGETIAARMRTEESWHARCGVTRFACAGG